MAGKRVGLMYWPGNSAGFFGAGQG